MSRLRISIVGLVVAVTLAAVPVAAQDAEPMPGTVDVVAAGLINPRGFTWGSDGTLYVASAGNGGAIRNDQNESGASSAVTAIAEFVADDSGAVVRVDEGCPVVVAAGLPSSSFVPLNQAWGASDVAILDGTLYVLVDGGGEGGLHPNEPNGVYRVEPDGTTTLISDLSAWLRANPVAEATRVLTPDGEPYAMVAVAGLLWIAESHFEQILTVAPDGTTRRLIDLSLQAIMPVGVPTGIAAAPDGGVYVGFLTEEPLADGTAKVVEIAPNGTVRDVWTGLTMVVDIALGPDGALYALEMATGNSGEPPFYRPRTGRVVRQTGPNASEEIATGLNYPIHLGFGPDGGLHVAGPAIGANTGQGTIVRIEISAHPVSLAGAVLPSSAC
jgi:hypothetical protein